MSSKPGRNDPCHCGSGQKYKRCCLPREEAERAEAVKQQALWDEEDDFEDDDLPDEYVEDVPPFDPDAVRTVRYERGFVQTLDALERGRCLRLTEWTAPSIPRQILECLECEAVDDLDGFWGDAEVGNPIQVDIVEVVTHDDLIAVEVLNRAILLLHTAVRTFVGSTASAKRWREQRTRKATFSRRVRAGCPNRRKWRTARPSATMCHLLPRSILTTC